MVYEFFTRSATGSGPKGRGFESRHFDRTENPGSVRLPGSFFFPEAGREMWKKCGKLGEGSGHKRRNMRKINGCGLGEMGEKSTGDQDRRRGNRKRTGPAAGSARTVASCAPAVTVRISPRRHQLTDLAAEAGLYDQQREGVRAGRKVSGRPGG